jgi:hypothetical protein
MLEGFPLYFWEFLILNLPLYRLLMSKINYSFPRGIGTNDAHLHQPYMILTSYESKNAIESNGAIPMSSIVLYIPPNALKTDFDSTYENADGAATKAAFGSAMKRTAEAGIGDTLLAGLKGAGLTSVSSLARQAEKGTGMLAAQGIAINSHMALIYKGPSKFRTHNFMFSFFPKNEPEAKNVKRILADFQNGMLPRMGDGFQKIKGRKLSQPLFHAPRHWTIEFFTKHGTPNDYLIKIGKSVITTMSINHDPSSTVSLHEGTGSPVQTTLTLGFQEIELQISSDEAIEGDTTITPATTPQSAQVDVGELLSDFRLKDNITLLQEEGFGIPNIYSFNYKWDTETTWIGVMAQELLDTGYSDAVGTDSEGFYNVDYSRLGFPMIGFK